MKKLMLNALLVTSLCSVVVPAFGMESVKGFAKNIKANVAMPTPTAMGATFAAFTLWKLYSRNATVEFQSRFESGKLTESPREFAKQLWYLYSDNFVGQAFKSKSHTLGEGLCEHKLQFHAKDCPPAGLCGLADFHVLKVGKKAFESGGWLLALGYTMHKGGLIEVFRDIAKNGKVSSNCGQVPAAQNPAPAV